MCIILMGSHTFVCIDAKSEAEDFKICLESTDRQNKQVKQTMDEATAEQCKGLAAMETKVGEGGGGGRLRLAGPLSISCCNSFSFQEWLHCIIGEVDSDSCNKA